MAGGVFACTVQFPTFFLRVCQIFRFTFPITQRWNTAVCSQLPSLQGSDVRCLFSGVFAQRLGTYCLEPPMSGCPLGLLSWAFQAIFTSSYVLYQLQQRNDSFRTWWHWKSLTIKWRSIFYGCCLSFHDRPNNLFALAAFNRGSRDLPHFPRVKIKLSIARCSGLPPTHKSSAHSLQGNLGISCLRNGRAEVLCVQLPSVEWMVGMHHILGLC